MKIWKIIFWLIIFLVVIFAILLIFSSPKAKADLNPNTNVDSVERYAWNNIVGWIDFHGTHTVKVETDKLTGYASSDVGDIELDCATSPTPPADCASFPGWQVTNDGNGNLSGWAWNNAIGWISFDCTQTNNCFFPYRVTIDQNGYFQNYAWNNVIGWISFNCANPGTNGCNPPSGSNYKVKANWQPPANS